VNRRVLLVDDVMLNRKLAIAFMSRMGWETLEVDGGLVALQWLRTHPPVDLVLLDISMPDLSGEEVCKQLRADPAFADLKIVAYTAHAGPDDIERFLANGFDAALIKPITSQRLKDVVAGLFHSAA
jgi:CheY-like chemotaxis protein